MTQPTSFDLVDHPWVRARRPQGEIIEVSLVDALANAHELTNLAGDLPTQDAAVLRLLLTIQRRVYREVLSPADWETLWKSGSLDRTRIEDYLDAHRDRFDLLHPDAPFFQVAGLRTTKGELTDLARLVPDLPAGHQYFTARSRADVRTLSFAEAARWVVHCQSFDASGIKSGAVGDDRVTGGKGYPIGIAWCGWLGLVVVEGRNLFETLMLNFRADLRSGEDDRPVWERTPQGPGVESGHAFPHGPADLSTWQSRRIRLGHDGEKATGVLIANGDPLHPRDRFDVESMTGWRYSEPQTKATKSPTPVFMPRAHSPERAVWRGLPNLLARDDSVAKSRAGGWLEWLSTLQVDGCLPLEFPIRIHTVGMEYGAQSAVVADVVDDALNLPLAVLTSPQMTGVASTGVHNAEDAVRALGQLASDLVRAGGGDRDLAGAAWGETREQGFATLDTEYRRWIGELRPDRERDDVLAAWQGRVRQLVEQLARQLLDAATPVQWAGKHPEGGRPVNAATASNWFHLNLKKALPLAYPPLEKGPEA